MNVVRETPTFPTRGHPLVPLGLVAAVVAVSTSAIFVRLSTLPPSLLAFYRLAVSALIFFPAVSVTGSFRTRSMSRRDFWLTGAAGALLGVHYALWFTSLDMTSVTSATVFVTIHPVFVLPLSYLLWRETTTKKAVLGLAAALIGGLLISMKDAHLGEHHLGGDALALLAAAAMGGYLMIGSVVRPRVSLPVYMALVNVVGAFVLFVFVLISRIPFGPLPSFEWWIIIALALMPTLVGHNLFNWALRYASPAIVSVSVLGEPVIATGLAAWLFQEMPSGIQLFGAGLMIVGVGWFTLTHPGLKK